MHEQGAREHHIPRAMAVLDPAHARVLHELLGDVVWGGREGHACYICRRHMTPELELTAIDKTAIDKHRRRLASFVDDTTSINYA